MVRRLAIVAACGFAGLMAGAAPAEAAVHSCRFTNGIIGNINPPIGLSLVNAGYYMQSVADCTRDTGTRRENIGGAGAFVPSFACGAARLEGEMQVGTDSFGYRILLVGGVGVMDVTSGGTGGGVLHIVPRQGDCVSGITEYSVLGAFVVATL